jgi:hypothetical protein
MIRLRLKRKYFEYTNLGGTAVAIFYFFHSTACFDIIVSQENINNIKYIIPKYIFIIELNSMMFGGGDSIIHRIPKIISNLEV